jgi:hypothetical protein
MTKTPDREPSTGFTLGPERVGEGNWEWFRAEGFRPYETLSPEEAERQHRKRVSLLMDQFGLDNVCDGDVYDPESDRPLRHMPGMTIYVRGEPIADPSQSGKPRAGA